MFFSNKTDEDIILKPELDAMLGKNFINIITRQPGTKHYQGKIDTTFLQEHITDFKQPFYVCGPDAFNDAILDILKDLGAQPEALVFEK